MKLIDAIPIGTKKSLVHLNRGSQPHSWEYRDFPVYAEYPDGERLRERRKALHFSQREAAKKLSVSVAEYSQLENGRKILAPVESMDNIISELEQRKPNV